MKTITTKANQSAKTFTIRTYENGNLTAKYKTNPMSQEEFENEEMNTENDWKKFLKKDEYYTV